MQSAEVASKPIELHRTRRKSKFSEVITYSANNNSPVSTCLFRRACALSRSLHTMCRLKPLRTRQCNDGTTRCVEIIFVSLCLFSEGPLQNRGQFKSERQSGYDMHIVQGLCPRMQKKKTTQQQHLHHIRKTRRKHATKQDKDGTIRTRPLFLMPFTRMQRQER